MAQNDTRADFPKGRTTHGLSLITTGHSGAGTFMCACAWQFYRLHRPTGERHFLAVYRSLLYNTKQMTNWDGTLGYAHRALQTEAARHKTCPAAVVPSVVVVLRGRAPPGPEGDLYDLLTYL